MWRRLSTEWWEAASAPFAINRRNQYYLSDPGLQLNFVPSIVFTHRQTFLTAKAVKEMIKSFQFHLRIPLKFHIYPVYTYICIQMYTLY